MTLFVAEKNPEDEKWSGPRTGVRAAGEIFRADNAHPITEFPTSLSSLVSSSSHVFSDMPTQKENAGYKKLFKRLQTSLTKRSYEYDSTMSTIPASRRRPLKPKIGWWKLPPA